MERLDVVIIGAGWSGLAALRTYRQVKPDASMAVLESAGSVGGVWAKERLYASLKTNNIRGSFEFSDYPMDDTFAVGEFEHIPGTVVHTYMERYVEHFQLGAYIRLNTTVRVVERQDHSDTTWTLTTTDGKTIIAKKLIVCTGLTSQPDMPTFTGQETFAVPLCHSHDLPTHQDTILTPGKRITVLGGGKSSWDCVYAAVTRGAEVDWVIRDNGHGPSWMTKPYATATPTKIWIEKLMLTRACAWFSPCVWGAADGHTWIRSFLNGTWLGRKLIAGFWAGLMNNTLWYNQYNAHPETRKLRPWGHPFWVATTFAVLNHDTDFFNIVKSGKVHIHIAQVDRLSPHTVHLKTTTGENPGPGEAIPSDGLIACTGWLATPNIDFRPASLAQTLGFPWADDPIPQEMVQGANSEILRRFPYLRNDNPEQPSLVTGPKEGPASVRHPFRLSRFMVPPSLAQERSIAFMGIVMAVNTPMIAQAQALWITAYLEGSLSLTPEKCPEEVRDAVGKLSTKDVDLDLLWDTALYSQWSVFRCPAGMGKRNPDIIFDSLPYVDLLLGDLGLKTVRKRSLFEWFVPYEMADYKGLVREWLDLCKVNGAS